MSDLGLPNGQEAKAGHKTTELGLSLVSIIAMLKIGLDSEDPIMKYIAMTGCVLVSMTYLWSRTRVKTS